jgi:hypothetical protein
MAVMKLGVSVLGARRGESGDRCRRGEALGCSRCPFIRVEAERRAVQEELDGRRWWALMTFSMPVTGLKIEGNRREGDRMAVVGGPLMKLTVSKPQGGKGRRSGVGSMGEERRHGLLGSSGGVRGAVAH